MFDSTAGEWGSMIWKDLVTEGKNIATKSAQPNALDMKVQCTQTITPILETSIGSDWKLTGNTRKEFSSGSFRIRMKKKILFRCWRKTVQNFSTSYLVFLSNVRAIILSLVCSTANVILNGANSVFVYWAASNVVLIHSRNSCYFCGECATGNIF